MEEHGYYLHNIRALLINGFDERGLRNLCFDVPDLRPVHARISRGCGKEDIVAELVEYADTHLLLDTLLALARDRNPARYDKHGPYYAGDPTAILQRNISDLSRQLMVMMSSLCAFYSPPKVSALMNLLARIEDILYSIGEMRFIDDTSRGAYVIPTLLAWQGELQAAAECLLKDHACALVCLSSLVRVREWEESTRQICKETGVVNVTENGVDHTGYRQHVDALNRVRYWRKAIQTRRRLVACDLTQMEHWLSLSQEQAKGQPKARFPNRWLKAARQRAGLTQKALARRVGVSQSTVGKWEWRGVIPRSSETRQAVANVLDCWPWPTE